MNVTVITLISCVDAYSYSFIFLWLYKSLHSLTTLAFKFYLSNLYAQCGVQIHDPKTKYHMISELSQPGTPASWLFYTISSKVTLTIETHPLFFFSFLTSAFPDHRIYSSFKNTIAWTLLSASEEASFCASETPVAHISQVCSDWSLA